MGSTLSRLEREAVQRAARRDCPPHPPDRVFWTAGDWATPDRQVCGRCWKTLAERPHDAAAAAHGRRTMIAENAMIGFAPCFACKRPFAFDVDRVPSYAGKAICRPCIDHVNEKRRAAGRPTWPVPPGAYPLDDD
jgi:hypothetical protein